MKLIEIPIQKAIETIIVPLIKSQTDEYLKDIANIKELRLHGIKPEIIFSLDGLEDKEFTATIDAIDISEDGSSITFTKFGSNYKFLETALNRYAIQKIDVTNPIAQTALKGVRKLFM